MVRKYSKTGWFKESDRHRLARMGVKTGKKLATVGVGLSKMSFAKEKIFREAQIDTRIYFNAGNIRGFEDYGDHYDDYEGTEKEMRQFSKESATERFRKKYPDAKITKVTQDISIQDVFDKK